MTGFFVTKKYYFISNQNVLYNACKEDTYKHFVSKNGDDAYKRSRNYIKIENE